ncbi:hypothetical protein VYU27_005976, partial [Nannochloropsis oceanica]
MRLLLLLLPLLGSTRTATAIPASDAAATTEHPSHPVSAFPPPSNASGHLAAAADAAADAAAPMPDMDPPVNAIEEQIALHGHALPAQTCKGSFEDGFAGWTSLEGARNESIVLVSTPVRAGKQAARVTVNPGEMTHHGNRAEITHNLEDAPGTVGWYAWSVLIPLSYPTDEDPTRNWQIICQWHDQPDLDAGQSWDGFPPHNSSIALYLLNHPNRTSLAMGVGFNLPKGTWQYGPVVIEKGEWVDVLFHIGWSTGDDGFIHTFIEGGKERGREMQALTPPEGVRGRTLFYQYTDYLKLGLYREPSINYTSTLYLDELRCGPTKESVALPPLLEAGEREGGGRGRRGKFRTRVLVLSLDFDVSEDNAEETPSKWPVFMSYNGGGGGFRGHGGRGGGADPVHVKPWRPAPSSSAENANFLTDCYYYLNDMCTKGPDCSFRHNEHAKRNHKSCNTWMQGGNCKVECYFRHPGAAAPAAGGEGGGGGGGGGGAGEKAICKFFASGKCRNGARCSFRHDHRNAEPTTLHQA